LACAFFIFIAILLSRVPTGEGKLKKVTEIDWSGKDREKQKLDRKSGKCRKMKIPDKTAPHDKAWFIGRLELV